MLIVPENQDDYFDVYVQVSSRLVLSQFVIISFILLKRLPV